jgi:TolB protein
MNADGNRQRRLTSGGGDNSTSAGLFYETDPAWSPDGTHIAFASKREGTFDIFVMTREGKDVTRITSTKAEDTHPTWSPDGKRIAFSRSGRLEVMDADGSHLRAITAAGEQDGDPAWSPDGRWIAFSRVLRDVGGTVREIWLVKPDGSGNHAVTSFTKSSGSPSWAPDSKRLAFTSNAHGGRFAIYTIRLDGKGLERLTTTGADAIDPAWSPDGQTIAFSRDGSIVAIAADRSNEETLTESKNNDSSPAWNPVERRR